MDVEAHRLREHDDQGRLIAAGFTWPVFRYEAVKTTHSIVMLCYMGVAFPLVFGVMGLIAESTRAIGQALLVIAMLMIVAAIWAKLRMSKISSFIEDRTVMFRSDGAVMMRASESDTLHEASTEYNGVKGTTKKPLLLTQINSIETRHWTPEQSVFNGPFSIGGLQTSLIWQVFFLLADGTTPTIFAYLANKDDAEIVRENLDQALQEVRRAIPRAMR